MSASAIRAARAFVELYGDDSKLRKTLSSAQARLQAFGSSVRGMGAKMLGAAGLGAAPIIGAVKTFADFQAEMSRVKALTGATGEVFDQLETKARALGSTTTFTSREVAGAMAELAQAGFNTQQVMDGIGPTLDLAAAGNLDIAEAASIAAKTINGMKLGVTELPHVVDVLAKAANESGANLQLLGDAFKHASGFAKAAGLSFEETTAALMILADGGLVGEMGGTGLRSVFAALLSPSDVARKAMVKLGVETTDGEGNTRSIADIVADLQAGLAGLGTGDRMNMLGQIFDTKALNAASLLIEAGPEALREKTRSLGDSVGYASKMAVTLLDNIKGAWERLTGALDETKIWVGKVFGGQMTTGLNLVQGTVEMLGSALKSNTPALLSFAKGLATMAAVGAGLLAVGTALAGIATAVGLLASPLGIATVALTALGVAAVESLSGSVVGAVQEAAAALANGQVELAAQLFWKNLELMWVRGTKRLTEIFETAWGTMALAINEINMVFGGEDAAAAITAAMHRAIAEAGNAELRIKAELHELRKQRDNPPPKAEAADAEAKAEAADAEAKAEQAKQAQRDAAVRAMSYAGTGTGPNVALAGTFSNRAASMYSGREFKSAETQLLTQIARASERTAKEIEEMNRVE